MSNDDKKIIYSMLKVSKYYENKPILKDISLSYFYGAKIVGSFPDINYTTLLTFRLWASSGKVKIIIVELL